MKTTSKHAYCIMAHGGWEQLQMLLDVLDDARNDIFLHIDAKSIASFENIGGISSCNTPNFIMRKV